MKSLATAVCFFSCFISSYAFCQEAPLGLTWSTSAESVRRLGVDLKETSVDSYGSAFTANKLSKALADQESTYLSFGRNDKLWRIVIISNDFSNDPMGIAVKNRYNDLLRILSEKYGKPKSFHKLGDSIFAESQYFLAGLQGGRSFWYSNFSAEDIAVQIGIIATSSSDARWRIIYEYKPLKAEFARGRKAREKDAL